MALSIVSGLLWGLDRLGWARPIKIVLEVPIAPVRLWFADTKAGVFNEPRKIADLERQVAELTVDASKATLLAQENAELRKVIGASSKPQANLQPVRVVGRGGEWLIAGGKREGIEVGQVVVSGDGVMVGLVSWVDEFVSRVKLLTDEQNSIEAQTEGGTLGVVKGEGGKVVFGEVLQKDLLEVGMRTISREGIVIGIVKEVRQVAAEVYKSAVVEPLYDQSAKYVFIVR